MVSKRRRRTVTVTPPASVVEVGGVVPTITGEGVLDTNTPATLSAVYGSAISMDGLGNMQVGGAASGASNTYVSQRFKAEYTSTLVSVSWLCVGTQFSADGYAGGTGGTIRMTVETDSGGLPSGNVLATYDFVPGSPSPNFLTRSFSSPPSLTAGSLYHIVHTNIDASPTVNFVSVDGVFNFDPVSPRQPRWPSDEWVMCRKFGTGPWSVVGNYTPILQLTYGSGAVHGQGYAQVNLSDYGVISGTTSMVRQRITPTASQTVLGAAVRMAKTSGTGNVLVRLETSGGTVIDSFTASTTAVPTRTPTVADDAGVWVTGTFTQPNTLAAGSTYYLRLSTDTSTSLWVRPILQTIGDGGFTAITGFADGYCEKTTDGTTWAAFSSYSTLGDLQFYLTTA